jgi:hypothetical protein
VEDARLDDPLLERIWPAGGLVRQPAGLGMDRA